MKYTQAQLTAILSKAYCCIGTLGDKLRKDLRIGRDCSSNWMKLQQTQLFAWALANYTLDEEGEDDGTNVLSETEMNQVAEGIINNCGCSTIDDLASEATVEVSSDYWTNGYTADDEGNDSYNG
jgi:hypothetical protein